MTPPVSARATPPVAPPDPRRWWTLGVVCLATFMLLIDITIVNVALPSIARDLGSSFTDLQWVVDAYALSLASLLLTAGSLADLFGRRMVFVVGLTLFTVSSLLCGIATTPNFLTLARAAQGIGGAAMFATSLSLIAAAFSGPERGKAFGVWGATVASAVAIGPLVGGALTEHAGWQSIFLVNIPLGIAGIVLALRRVAESRDPHPARVDRSGLVTFSGGLFMLVLALLRGNAEGWTSTLIVALLAGAAIALAAFVVTEWRSDHPMFDLRLLRVPAFSGASIAAFCLSAGMFSMFLYLTLYMQNTLGYSPLATGVRFLPLTVPSFFAAIASGALSQKVPARVTFLFGMGLAGTGLLMMRGIDAESGWTELLPGLVVTGIGVGLTNPALASAAVGVVEPRRSGMASGANNTFRQVGLATGIAAFGALLEHLMTSRFGHGVPGAALATGNPAVVPTALRGEFLADYTSALNVLALVGASLCLFAAIAAFALVRPRDFDVSHTGAAPGGDGAAAAEPA